MNGVEKNKKDRAISYLMQNNIVFLWLFGMYGFEIQERILAMFRRRIVISKMRVMPAEAGIQRLKSLDPGQKQAGMTTSGRSRISLQAV
jgi:hypothetical protein